VKVLAALTADRAKDNGDGTVDVSRGGINLIYTSGYPALVKFSYLLRLELDEGEAEDLHRFRLDISHNGKAVGPPFTVPVAAPGNRMAGMPIYVNVIGNLQFPVLAEGEIVLAGWVNEDLAVPLVKIYVKTLPILFARPG
jgi:hypothetical protein